jgi:hypothetical protein
MNGQSGHRAIPPRRRTLGIVNQDESAERLALPLFERLQSYPDLGSRLAADIRSCARVDPDNLPIAAAPSVDPAAPGPAPSTAVTAALVPVEQHLTLGKYKASQPAESVLAERIEQPMVPRFCDFLSAGGYPAEVSGTRSTVSTTSQTSWCGPRGCSWKRRPTPGEA